MGTGAKKPRQPKTSIVAAADYRAVLSQVSGLLEQARSGAARVVNAFMTAAYWQIGRRIVEHEQVGAGRAIWDEQLIERLSVDLTRRYGRGFSRQNLQLMRAFYLTYSLEEIRQTASGKPHDSVKIRQMTSGESCRKIDGPRLEILQTLSAKFPLPWSHYVRLLSVKEADARRFYEAEAIRGGWTVKQIDRQINSLFYQRTMLSKNKAAMLTKGQKPKLEDILTPEQQIKDPFVLEFLDLKDEYSEGEIEESLIRHLEAFLLELGGDFTFVGRQKRLRIGHQWYRIDLLFFHRRLRCLVIIDLKTGEFTHADAGQMHLYCNYAAEHWTQEGENPPVGLILCAEKDASIAHYALDNLPNKILAAEYRMKLPAEKTLAKEVEKTRRMLENRAAGGKSGAR